MTRRAEFKWNGMLSASDKGHSRRQLGTPLGQLAQPQAGGLHFSDPKDEPFLFRGLATS
jgi:hypothetical protein